MGWLKGVGEFCGGFLAGHTERREKIKQRKLITAFVRDQNEVGDITQMALSVKSPDCMPFVDTQISKKGAKKVLKLVRACKVQEAQSVADLYPGTNRKELCMLALKLAIRFSCADDPIDLIRSATYTVLAYDFYQ